MMDDFEQKLKQEGATVRHEVRERVLGYIIAAFGFVAGLAWNDAIKALIEYLFPLKENTLIVRFVYAAVVTILVVVITVYLTRVFKKDQTNS
jgi:hypothetical protein